MNNQSDIFYFSNWYMENYTMEQIQLATKYSFIDLFIDKTREEIKRITSKPDRISDDGIYEYYQMSSDILMEYGFYRNITFVEKNEYLTRVGYTNLLETELNDIIEYAKVKGLCYYIG